MGREREGVYVHVWLISYTVRELMYIEDKNLDSLWGEKKTGIKYETFIDNFNDLI